MKLYRIILHFSQTVVYIYIYMYFLRYCVVPFSLSPSCFQDNVEIHVAHIQSGLSQLGNLHAFSINNTNRT